MSQMAPVNITHDVWQGHALVQLEVVCSTDNTTGNFSHWGESVVRIAETFSCWGLLSRATNRPHSGDFDTGTMTPEAESRGDCTIQQTAGFLPESLIFILRTDYYWPAYT